MPAGYEIIATVVFTSSELRFIGLTAAVMTAAAVTYYAKVGGSIAPFVISGAALALLASLVGRSVEALGGRSAPGRRGWSKARWGTCRSCSWCCSR